MGLRLLRRLEPQPQQQQQLQQSVHPTCPMLPRPLLDHKVYEPAPPVHALMFYYDLAIREGINVQLCPICCLFTSM